MPAASRIAEQPQAELRHRRWRVIFVALVVALFVARAYCPGDLPAFGEGIQFVMLWLLLGTGWFTLRAINPRLPVRFGMADLLLLAASLWYVLAGVLALPHGQPRAMINSLWEWSGIVLTFFLFRQLVGSAAEGRAILVAGIGVAAGLALFGLYQYVYEFPRTRAAFLQDPQAVLAQAGVYVPPGSREEVLFRSRLFSTEPVGTFALANSFAGLLLAWFLVGVGVLLSIFSPRDDGADRVRSGTTASPPGSPRISSPNEPSRKQGLLGWLGVDAKGRVVTRVGRVDLVGSFLRQIVASWAFRFLLSSALVGAILWVLVLTKSRSALLAATFGVVLLVALSLVRRGPDILVRLATAPAETENQRAVNKQRVPLSPLLWIAPIVLALFLGLAGVLVGLGFLAGWDWQVLSEAPKSVGYRLQYWIATGRMIADRPVFGCGPGNFQLVYTRYMLPEASEVIADPHNFVLEVAACGGIPAACLFVAAVGILLFGKVGPTKVNGEVSGQPIRGGEVSGEAQAVAAASAGANAGASNSSTPAQAAGDEAETKSAVGAIVLGAVLGVFAGWGLSLFSSVPASWVAVLTGVSAIAVAFAGWGPWIFSGVEPSVLARIAAGSLLLHLCAAGGIAIPGVAGSLWVLLAIGVLGSEPPRVVEEESRSGGTAVGTGMITKPGAGVLSLGRVCPSTTSEDSPPVGQQSGKATTFFSWVRRWLAALKRPILQRVLALPWQLSGTLWKEFILWGGRYTPPAVLAILSLMCYFTAYRPVLACRGYLLAAQRLATEGGGPQVQGLFLDAWRADPLSPEPALALAQLAWGRWAAGDHRAAREFERWSAEFIRLAGGGAKAWETVADLYWQLAELKGEAELLRNAARAYEAAAERFPTNGGIRAKLAQAYMRLGLQAEAQREAEMALKLDAVNPHKDRKLSAEMRQAMERICSPHQMGDKS